MIVVFVGVVVGNFLFNIYLDKVDNLVAETNESEMTWWSVQIASEISVNAIIFMVIFQIMTREKVWWRHAIYGGFLTAILWQPGRYLIATSLISEKYTPFGIVGAFLAVLLWLFYGMNALLFGGTVVHVAGKEREQHELSDSDV